jgi:hypothetical protein
LANGCICGIFAARQMKTARIFARPFSIFRGSWARGAATKHFQNAEALRFCELPKKQDAAASAGKKRKNE